MPQINFKYKFNEDYNPVYVNGAYGGISSRGEIIANFFLERQPIPKTEACEVNSKGIIKSSKITEPIEHRFNVIRYVETGVIMNIETAKIIRNWLNDKIAELEKLSEEKGKKS